MTTYDVGDFLDQLEHELHEQRRLAAHHVDRADALATFRNRALAVAASLNRAITVEDVFDAAQDEQERAALHALADRITGEGMIRLGGSDDSEGHRSESGAVS
jgi:hypothetical protein